MSEIIIKTKNLHKHYKMSEFEVKALDSVSIQINKGEYVALTGASGSGKSTLLNVLGCLDTVTSGEYFLNEKNITKMSDSALSRIRNSNIGFIFQSYNLIPNLNAFDNVQLTAKYRKYKNLLCKELALKALERVGLSDRIHHHPRQLSGGQQQRVAIARAILTNPDILLADEPTGNLDTRSSGEILELLKDLNRSGTTIILVTHDKQTAESASRNILMCDGKIISDTKCEVVL